jgi:hypothetical protein
MDKVTSCEDDSLPWILWPEYPVLVLCKGASNGVLYGAGRNNAVPSRPSGTCSDWFVTPTLYFHTSPAIRFTNATSTHNTSYMLQKLHISPDTHYTFKLQYTRHRLHRDITVQRLHTISAKQYTSNILHNLHTHCTSYIVYQLYTTSATQYFWNKLHQPSM